MNISILGCGWLGLPLAKRLLDEGHVIKGSTTSREKMNKLTTQGITPYQIKLFPGGVQGDLTAFLSDSEVLIIDIPPGIRGNPEADFVTKIGILKGFIESSNVEQVLFVSSTSVFEDKEEFPVYTEGDKPNGTAENAIQLIAAEEILRSSATFITTIVRFGGLMGPGRHPVNSLSGRRDVKNPRAPVNLIYREDCLGIIKDTVEKEAWGEIFHGVYPTHPGKEEYYKLISVQRNLALPEFDEQVASKGKIITSLKVEEELGYIYQHGIISAK